jgi:hypothetical protein
MNKPDPILHSQTAHLFIMHVWIEKGNQEKTPRFYGKIQRAPEGDCLYFRNWEVLIHFLEEQLTVHGNEDDLNSH